MGTAGMITLSRPRLFRCTKERVAIEDMSHYIQGGWVEWNGDNDGSLMRCQLEVTRPELFHAIKDFVYLSIDIQPWAKPLQTVTWGPFRLWFGDENHAPSASDGVISGDDVSILLDKSILMAKTTIPKGTNYGVALQRSLTQVLPASRLDIRSTSRVMSRSWTYYRGTPERKRSGEITEAIGWYRPHMNMAGNLTTLPYRDFSKIEPIALWDGSVIQPPIRRQAPPDGDIFNVVVVTRDRGDAQPLVSVRENNDPRSPVSIPSLDGQREPKFISNSTAEDQEAITDASRNILQEGAMRYEGLNFKVPPDKSYFGIFQSVELNLQALGAEFVGRYHLRRWRFDFSPTNALIDVDVYRVIEVDI